MIGVAPSAVRLSHSGTEVEVPPVLRRLACKASGSRTVAILRRALMAPYPWSRSLAWISRMRLTQRSDRNSSAKRAPKKPW
ncbi:hypothetical protein D3C86_1950820 [compost metagenome]